MVVFGGRQCRLGKRRRSGERDRGISRWEAAWQSVWRLYKSGRGAAYSANSMARTATAAIVVGLKALGRKRQMRGSKQLCMKGSVNQWVRMRWNAVMEALRKRCARCLYSCCLLGQRGEHEAAAKASMLLPRLLSPAVAWANERHEPTDHSIATLLPLQTMPFPKLHSPTSDFDPYQSMPVC